VVFVLKFTGKDGFCMLSQGEKTFLIFLAVGVVLTIVYGFVSNALPPFKLKGR